MHCTLKTSTLQRQVCPWRSPLILIPDTLLACLPSCRSCVRTRILLWNFDHNVIFIQSDTLQRRTCVDDIILENHKALTQTTGKITVTTVAALPGCPIAAAAPSVRAVYAAPPSRYFPTL